MSTWSTHPTGCRCGLRWRKGDWFTPGSPEVVEYRQDLDLRRGVLTRLVRLRDGAGRVTRVTSERFVSQHARHLAALRTTFEAENWSGACECSRRWTAA